MTSWLDVVLIGAFAIAWPVWAWVEYDEHKRRVRLGVPGERLASYAHAMIVQGLFVAAAVGLWIHAARDWQTIGLVWNPTWQSWAALGIAAAIGALFLLQSASVARRPETHEQVRAALAPYAELLPIDRNDLTGFVALSITAGVCEEVLFRGVLSWVLAHWVGIWAGHIIALVVFGAAHFYLGRVAVIRAALAGAAAAALYIWTGSLVPSMVLHATIDVASGWMAYLVLGDQTPGAAPSALQPQQT